ncbi:MAG: TRAP transporter substrate-binding protein [Bacillota bacterium]
MKRTRLSMVLALALAFALTALAGCGGTKSTTDPAKTNETKPAQQETKKEKPSFTLRLAENQAADYPTTIGDLDFAKRVAEKTNGRIKIDVYHGAQLGDEKTVIEQIQLGAIDFARVNVQPLGEFSKKIGVLNLPYLFDSEEHLWKVLNGPIGQEILDSLAGSRMVGLTYYDSGARSFYNSKREAKVPADLKGLKIRVQQSNLMVDLVNALGASATPMAYGEVYNGLKSGVIDGAENNWPSYYSTSHYEVAKFITLDYHTRSPEVIIASQALWDKLDAEDRQIILEAAKASTEVQRKAWKEYEQKSIDKVKAAGNTITEVTDLKAWQDAVAGLYDTHGASFKDLIAKIKAAK